MKQTIHKLILSVLLVCLATVGIQAQTTRERSLSLDPSKADWFREAKFGLFLHWGLYSILEGSYDGHTLPDTTLANGRSWYAEWIQKRLEIPDEAYRNLAKSFNPTEYDPEAWVLEAKNAGMRYIIITAKHHDGFALWNSKVSDFDIARTPYKKDLLGPLVKACRKHGIKYGFYYSHWQDWEHPGGALPFWEAWRPDDEFEKYWQEKSLPQVKELLVRYDPDLLWFDTWNWDCHITPQRRDELIDLVRKYSSKCLVNGRICFSAPGENIDFLEMLDNDYPSDIQKKPWQTPATMQNSFGWHAGDFNWKSADEMLAYLVGTVAKGGNYLLNIGPKADGTFPVPAVRRLREMGAWLYANGEGIYGSGPVDIQTEGNVWLTQKKADGKSFIYIFIANPEKAVTGSSQDVSRPPESVFLPIKCDGDCQVLETGRSLECSSTPEGISISIPDDIFRDSSIQVLRLRCD